MAMPASRAPTWKRVLASILDFIMIVTVAGNVIAWAFNMLMPGGGFDLQGGPALLFFAAIIAYFYVGRRIAGGTLWDRFFGIVRPQPSS